MSFVYFVVFFYVITKEILPKKNERNITLLVVMLLSFVLFHQTLLQIFCQVGAQDTGNMVGSHLLHVVFHHDLYELLKGGGGRIPAEFSLGL